jgi:hypothetical protein
MLKSSATEIAEPHQGYLTHKLVQAVIKLFVTDGPLMGALSHRLRSEIIRWTRGNNSEAGCIYFLSLVTS